MSRSKTKPPVRHVHIRRIAPPSAHRSSRWGEFLGSCVVFGMIGFFAWGFLTLAASLGLA